MLIESVIFCIQLVCLCFRWLGDILIEILEFYGGGVDGSITAASIKSVTPTRFDAPRGPSDCILAPF